MNRRGFLKGLFAATVATVVPTAIVKKVWEWEPTFRDPHWGMSLYEMRMKYAHDAGVALAEAIDRALLDQMYLANNPPAVVTDGELRQVIRMMDEQNVPQEDRWVAV